METILPWKVIIVIYTVFTRVFTRLQKQLKMTKPRTTFQQVPGSRINRVFEHKFMIKYTYCIKNNNEQ